MADQCRYTSESDRWRCTEEVTTRDGLCIFHDPDLNKDVSLLKARFEARLADEKEDPLRLDGSIFPDGISFARVVFSRSVSFDRAQFHGQTTDLSRAQFGGQVTSFTGGQFYGQETIFDWTEFRGQETIFNRAQFHGQRTSFAVVQFPGQTTFVYAQFHSQETIFIGTRFYGRETTFARAQFHGYALFRGLRPSQVFRDGLVDFAWIRVREKGMLVFDWVDLSRVRLLHADFSRVRFLDVTWDHRPDWKIGLLQWGSWRSRVYDETLWREERREPQKRDEVDTKFPFHLGYLYRSLKAYYREIGEHHLVGHFHYGLMEVQWHQRRKWRKWVSWEALYRYSSGYGEDYGWAGLVLVSLLYGFAGAYWWLGIPSEMVGTPWWKQGLHSLLYSLQAGTLGRVGFYQEKVRLAARYLHLVESVLVPVQFGFFLFALRNRFRR